MGFISGRGAVAMWGYPLWLFLGVWIVMTARRVLTAPLPRIVATWEIVFTVLALAFVANYAVLPRFHHRYRAVFFPARPWPNTLPTASPLRPAAHLHT